MPPPVISYSQVYFAVFCSPCKDQRCSIAVMIVRQRYVLGIALWSVVCIGLCAGASAVDCSETECGPRVSKCMLLKACNCSITRENILNNTCTCCTECIQCLDKQYTQCCSCFGMFNWSFFIKLSHKLDMNLNVIKAVAIAFRASTNWRYLRARIPLLWN